MKPCIEYEALYRGSWRSERTAIEKNVLEVAQAELASTASERCRCDPLKPEFNPFRFQPAPPLPRPHLHKMLLNGIGPRRAYFKAFFDLVERRSPRRAVVLMGPRRVGKTVMINQAVQSLLDGGTAGTAILYVSLYTPLYTGLWMEKLLNLFMDEHGHGPGTELFVFFDEVQYHP